MTLRLSMADVSLLATRVAWVLVAALLLSSCSDERTVFKARAKGAEATAGALRLELASMRAQSEAQIQAKKAVILILQNQASNLTVSVQQKEAQIDGLQKQLLSVKGPPFAFKIAVIESKKIVVSQSAERVERGHHTFSDDGKFDFQGRKCLEDPYIERTVTTYGYSVTCVVSNITKKAEEVAVTLGDVTENRTIPARDSWKCTLTSKAMAGEIRVKGKEREIRNAIRWSN